MSFALSNICRSFSGSLSKSLVRPNAISNQFFASSSLSGFNIASASSSCFISRSFSTGLMGRPLYCLTSPSHSFMSPLLKGIRNQPVAYASTMRKRRAKMNKVNIYIYAVQCMISEVMYVFIHIIVSPRALIKIYN